jgi:hypothetical protein
MRTSVAVLALFLALLAPSVAAQKPVDACSEQCAPTDADVNDPPTRSDGPVNVILYGHFHDVFLTAPLNTVPPDPVHEEDLDAGFLMPTVDTNSGACVPPGSQTCADAHFQNAQLHMWFCPGTIEFLAEGWYMGCHRNSPSMPLSVSGPAAFYLYLSGDSSPASVGAADTPSVMPSVRVSASIGIGTEDRTMVAYGVSDTATLVSMPGRPSVYEFRVDVTPASMLVDEDGHWMLGSVNDEPIFVDARIEQFRNEEGADAQVGQPDWRLHTGAAFPPRIILPTEEPLRSNGLETTAVNGTPYLRFTVHPAFGSYDVDTSSVQARVIKADGTAVDSQDVLELIDIERSVDHDGVHKPVSFVWRIAADELEPPASAYRIEVAATNLQGTFQVHESVPMPVTAFDGDAALPGPGPVALFVLLALLGLAVRRRATNR